MCDEHTEQDNQLSRRQFGAMGAGMALAAMLPAGAFAADLGERRVQITTPDGKADATFLFPKGKKTPGVLWWPDILGLRPAMEQMARRLASEGYAVLVIHPFYRSAPAPVVKPGESFSDPGIRERVMPMAKALSPATHQVDARAFLAWLDQQPEVDTQKGVGTQGYCMGGPMAFRAATTVPERVRAVASFHGGGLVTDAADSPHKELPRSKADYLVCIAQNDDERQPEAKDALREAFAENKLEAEVEVYPANHGWCPTDFPVYDQAQAERAWARLLALYQRVLA